MPDIQKLIDQLFLKNPQLKEYIEWAKYVPPTGEPPDGTTHTITLEKYPDGASSMIALRVDGPYDIILDALLQVL